MGLVFCLCFWGLVFWCRLVGLGYFGWFVWLNFGVCVFGGIAAFLLGGFGTVLGLPRFCGFLWAGIIWDFWGGCGRLLASWLGGFSGGFGV